MSTARIAIRYKCNPETIRRRLIEYGIKRRFREKKVKIPPNQLEELYNKRKISTIDISRRYNCSPWAIRSKLIQYGINIRKPNDYHKWKSPQNQIIPLLKVSSELSYILGVYLGDAWIYKYKHSYFIGLDTVDFKFAKSFCSALKRIKLHPSVFKKSNREVWRTIASSKIFFNWLKNLSSEDIKKIALAYPLSFLKGIYESEGCISRNYDKRVNKLYLSVVIVSCEKETIELTQNLIIALGLRPRLNLTRKKVPFKPIWVLSINRQSEVKSFLALVKPCIKNTTRRFKNQNLPV